MKLNFSDYHGPTGPYVATGGKVVPLTTHAGATAFAATGLQAGTIDPAQSAAIQAAAATAGAAVPSSDFGFTK